MAYKTIQIQGEEKSTQSQTRLNKRSQIKCEFKMRRRKDYTYNCTPTFYQEDIFRAVSGFCSPVYPIVSEFTPIIPIQCPIIPIPIIINPIPSIPSPIFQYCPLLSGPPLPPIPPGPPLSPVPSISPMPTIPPMVPIPPTNVSPPSSFNHSIENISNTDLDTNISAEITQELEIKELKDLPLETYLNLPKDLFPSARMLTLNPNAIIDEFCREADVENHTSWILDLEFGIPKCPITRPIPIYNVKFNSINCKNTPEAIHPGFESCRQDFKSVLLFYYDCVISSWYRGYVLLNSDNSVDNFQSWLSTAMQALGMCWA